ncbi:hypothetical protein PISL3812_07604 [Talaromyces islandicus]|uniref:Rhodopsin domain-containing protein n=1 Tax=Talaromyces islandicus TaxID=28573 RepID=A0A0U1M697_TALIS|nr:hypothetical protein PISL3812_07604 [Talaromyces islandicus]
MPALTPAQLAAWDETLQPVIYGVCITFFVLGNTSVPMRIWSQWRILQKAMPEDYCLIVALVSADVVTLATLLAAKNGFGQHVWRLEATAMKSGDKTLSNMQSIFTSIWLTSVFNGPCLIAIKLGLLLFYRRLFYTSQKWLAIGWWANLIYAVAWAIGSTVFFILQCHPIPYYWERLNPTLHISGHCSSGTHIVAIPLILSTVSDVAILVLPIFVVTGLRLTTQTKVGLVALFGFGFIAVGCGIARLIVLEVDTETATDPTYGTVAFEILNVVELNLAIICACIVPIFSNMRRIITGGSSKTSMKPGTQRLTKQSYPFYRSGEAARSPGSEYLHLSEFPEPQSGTVSSAPKNFSRSFSSAGNGNLPPDGVIQVKTELHFSSV